MVALGGLVLVAAVAVGLAGSWLVRPSPSVVGAPPPDLAATPLHIALSEGEGVAAWWLPGRPGGGAVLLLHGLRSDRRQMVGRARWLAREGFGVLLPDLPAHGESAGHRVAFGRDEARAVEAALVHLAQLAPREKVAVLGVSLGAAAAVFARPPSPPAAMVVESLYPTLADAARNRLEIRFGAAGGWLAPLLLWQLPLRHGVGADAFSPADELRAWRSPLLVAAGDADRHTPVAETQRLFDAAASPDKQLWLVPGAAHVDLHAHAGPAYEARVLAFLRRHLRPGG